MERSCVETCFGQNFVHKILMKKRSHTTKNKPLYGVSAEDVDYFIYHQPVQNSAYSADKEPIRIVNNKGQLLDIAEASDLSNLEALSKKVIKYALTYPKELGSVEVSVSSKY